VLGVVVGDGVLLDRRTGAGSLVGEPAGADRLLDLLDAGVARERQGAAADHLDAVVLLRVVGGGDDRAAVEVAAGDVEVHHVRADDADVGHRGPLAPRALDEGARDLGGREAHVAPDGDAGRAAQVIDERAAHPARDLAVDLRGIHGADVVGLEDGGVDRLRRHPRIVARRPPATARSA
jgi:hypothetical protein